MGGFPIELKRAGGAFNKTQLDYFCRYASRSKLLLTYIYGSLPSRDKFGKQLVDCLGCWTEAPPCVGKRKPWGGVLLWLGLDNNKKPRAYLPSPKGLCG